MAERLLEEVRKKGLINLYNLEDPVVVYVFGLKESLKKLREPLSWNMSHNRRRSVRGMAVARDQRLHQLRATEDALDTINNGKYEEIIFYKNEKGKMVGFTTKP